MDLQEILHDRRTPNDFAYLLQRNQFQRANSSLTLEELEVQSPMVRRNSCRMLGDDLVKNERRRILNAKRDTLQRQRRIEQIEAEIENKIRNESFEADADSISDDETIEPRTAAEWNRRIKSTIAKRNNESIEVATVEYRYEPNWVDIVWAIFWFCLLIGIIAIFCYRFKKVFVAIFDVIAGFSVYVYTVLSQQIYIGFQKIGEAIDRQTAANANNTNIN
ncbi:unnamed protein product [Caenorhabditis angaria]|uniref:Uncharacterized protein n=1 Tax=Caenorhabditis angaria TaxID=860376 RepID=A0A9P1J4J6_9PELO|nr:unnamed protein product [Caenorhabditis angaria]